MPPFLVLDMVSKRSAFPIGAAISKYLHVAGVPNELYELAQPAEIPDALVKLHKPTQGSGTLLLVAHANPQGFKVPGATSVFRWSAFARLLAEHLSSVNRLYLCGCETAGKETLETIFTEAPQMQSVYGTVEPLPFPHAVYGFISLLFHMEVKGKSAQEAIELVTRNTGVVFAGMVRPHPGR